MHVNIVFREKAFGNAELCGVRPRIAERRVSRFLHHVAELPCKGQRASALHCSSFNEEDVATNRSPRQTRGDADLIPLQQLILENLGSAEELIQVVGMNFSNLVF